MFTFKGTKSLLTSAYVNKLNNALNNKSIYIQEESIYLFFFDFINLLSKILNKNKNDILNVNTFFIYKRTQLNT